MHGLAFLIPLVGIVAACFALGASRASYYRARKPRPAPKPNGSMRALLSVAILAGCTKNILPDPEVRAASIPLEADVFP